MTPKNATPERALAAPANARRAGGVTGRPRSEKSRQAILAATLSLLEQNGLSNLTIETVASRAGVGKSTIYRWWPSRIALALDAIEELPAMTVPDTGDIVRDLRSLVRQLRDLLVNTPLGRVLGHLGSERAVLDPAVRAYIDRRIDAVAEVLQRAVERGELPETTDIADVTHLTMGPIVNRVFFDSDVPDDRFLERVVRTVVYGYARALED